jgi:hypothetical protein
MNQKITTLIFLFLVIFNAKGQQDSIKKSNAIFYPEIGFGIARLANAGTAGSFHVAANYQYNKSLFTFRFSQTAILQANSLDDIFAIDAPTENREYALMYGKRWIKEEHSLSISLGLSYNQYKDDFDFITNQHNSITNHIGVPFEGNIKWFHGKKKRFRLLGLVPIGPPSGFGRGIGFKLFGNLSRKSYVGLGIVYSLGYHREY